MTEIVAVWRTMFSRLFVAREALVVQRDREDDEERRRSRCRGRTGASRAPAARPRRRRRPPGSSATLTPPAPGRGGAALARSAISSRASSRSTRAVAQHDDAVGEREQLGELGGDDDHGACPASASSRHQLDDLGASSRCRRRRSARRGSSTSRLGRQPLAEHDLLLVAARQPAHGRSQRARADVEPLDAAAARSASARRRRAMPRARQAAQQRAASGCRGRCDRARVPARAGPRARATMPCRDRVLRAADADGRAVDARPSPAVRRSMPERAPAPARCGRCPSARRCRRSRPAWTSRSTPRTPCAGADAAQRRAAACPSGSGRAGVRSSEPLDLAADDAARSAGPCRGPTSASVPTTRAVAQDRDAVGDAKTSSRRWVM